MGRLGELSRSALDIIEPGLGALSPVQVGVYEQKPIAIDHDSHVKVYRQDLVLEQAQATYDSALQTPLTDANASFVVSLRQRAFDKLGRERAKAVDLRSTLQVNHSQVKNS